MAVEDICIELSDFERDQLIQAGWAVISGPHPTEADCLANCASTEGGGGWYCLEEPPIPPPGGKQNLDGKFLYACTIAAANSSNNGNANSPWRNASPTFNSFNDLPWGVPQSGTINYKGFTKVVPPTATIIAVIVTARISVTPAAVPQTVRDDQVYFAIDGLNVPAMIWEYGPNIAQAGAYPVVPGNTAPTRDYVCLPGHVTLSPAILNSDDKFGMYWSCITIRDDPSDGDQEVRIQITNVRVIYT